MVEAKVPRVEVVNSAPELVAEYAQLRADCEALAGHALAQKAHNADRWIAATAIRLGLPLVSVVRDLPRRTSACSSKRSLSGSYGDRIPDSCRNPVGTRGRVCRGWLMSRCGKKGPVLQDLLNGASRTRTGDLLGAIQALSQLSYSPGRRQMPRGCGTV